MCGTTTFLKSYAAVAGWLLASDVVARDRASWLAQMGAIQAQLMGAMPEVAAPMVQPHLEVTPVEFVGAQMHQEHVL